MPKVPRGGEDDRDEDDHGGDTLLPMSDIGASRDDHGGDTLRLLSGPAGAVNRASLSDETPDPLLSPLSLLPPKNVPGGGCLGASLECKRPLLTFFNGVTLEVDKALFDIDGESFKE